MSISSLTSAIKARETAISKGVMDSKPMSVYFPALKASTSKMGLSRNVLFLLGAGIFAICLALIVNAYVTQVNEYNDLSDELATVEGQTAGIAAQETLLQQSIAGYNDQIAQYDSQLIAAQVELTREMWVSSIFHDLLAVAQDNGVVITDGVDITNISSARSGTETIVGATYQAISVNMAVAGPESNIYSFVNDLTLSQSFTTGVLKTLSVSIAEDPAADSSANMLFTVYSL